MSLHFLFFSPPHPFYLNNNSPTLPPSSPKPILPHHHQLLTHSTPNFTHSTLSLPNLPHLHQLLTHSTSSSPTLPPSSPPLPYPHPNPHPLYPTSSSPTLTYLQCNFAPTLPHLYQLLPHSTAYSQVFNVDQETFFAMPQWKQANLKKEAGLF